MDGRASIMHKHDPPQTDTKLTFFRREHVVLRGGVVVQSQLDREPDQTADQTPKRASLSLFGLSADHVQYMARRVGWSHVGYSPQYTSTNEAKSAPEGSKPLPSDPASQRAPAGRTLHVPANPEALDPACSGRQRWQTARYFLAYPHGD